MANSCLIKMFQPLSKVILRKITALLSLSPGHAFSNHIPCPQILIGRHLEQHRLQYPVIDLILRREHPLLRKGVINRTDKTLEAFRLIDVIHAAVIKGAPVSPTV